jgi:hypothetical protein
MWLSVPSPPKGCHHLSQCCLDVQHPAGPARHSDEPIPLQAERRVGGGYVRFGGQLFQHTPNDCRIQDQNGAEEVGLLPHPQEGPQSLIGTAHVEGVLDRSVRIEAQSRLLPGNRPLLLAIDHDELARIGVVESLREPFRRFARREPAHIHVQHMDVRVYADLVAP